MPKPNATIPSAPVSDRASQEPHYVDVYVGIRLRMRRRMLGMSQTDLAKTLGITFQQLQKYERGTNRISASKLYAAARTLSVPVSFFFAALPDPDQDADSDARPPANLLAMLSLPEGAEMALLLSNAPDKGRHILDLLQSLVETDGTTLPSADS
jgi:transcriptional regulator with XRE-family HTH domain